MLRIPFSLGILSLAMTTGAIAQTWVVTVPEAWAGPDTVVRLPVTSLGSAAPAPGARPQVVNAAGQLLPAQAWDGDGDGATDAIVVVTDLAPGTTTWQYLGDVGGWTGAPRVQAELTARTGGTWDDEGVYRDGTGWQRVAELAVPGTFPDHAFYLRYEGPGWESEKVGYRLYLDGRNAIDIFGKQTPDLVLHTVGLDGYESYHAPAPWGLDVLKVGEALGLGSFGVWHDGAVQGVQTVAERRARVTADGPLVATHRLQYDGWQVAGGTANLVAQLSIVAGSRVTHVDLQVDGAVPNLATGMVKHPGTTVRLGPAEGRWSWVATWGPQSLGGGELGLAVLYPTADLLELTEDEFNHVIVLRPEAGLVHYAFLAAWSGEGTQAPQNLAAFLALVEAEARQLEQPVTAGVPAVAPVAGPELTLTADGVREVVVELAEAEMSRRGRSLANGEFDPEANRPARWTYTTGLLLLPYAQLATLLDEVKYLDYAQDIMGSYIGEDGAIVGYQLDEYNIDHLNPGKNLIALHQATGEERFRLAAKVLRDQMLTHPRTTEGGFWHKQRYPNQMWLDGLYMGSAFLAQYAAAYDEPDLFDDVVHQFVLMEQVAMDPTNGLLRHAWDETRTQDWADKESGLSPHVWGRAVGWYAMGLADTWAYLPADHPGRPVLAEILNRVVTAMKPYQHASGLWYQVVEQRDREGNYLESSATAMMAYAIVKGVRDGHLSKAHLPSGLRAFSGLVRDQIVRDAEGRPSLSGICQVAGLGFGRDGSYEYYLSEKIVHNDPKGLGPFLLAGLQVEALLRGQ